MGLDYLVMAILFAGVMCGIVGAGLWLQQSSASKTLTSDSAQPIEVLTQTFRRLGERVQDSPGKEDATRRTLGIAGYRSAAALDIFQGSRIAGALLIAVLLGSLAILMQGLDVTALLLAAICGGGFGYLLPERILQNMAHRRSARLRKSLPNAMDMLVLCVESGQSLDQSFAETARQMRQAAPDLAEEFQLINLEMRAGKSREEALRNLGARNGEQELRRLSVILLDSDRFGSNLGPTLRTQARFLRTRMRQQAQERARKIGVKLVFPLVLLIFPSMLLVTLGPPVIAMMESLGKNLGL